MELFNSVGIELEVENVKQSDVNFTPNLFRIHRDASCESDGYSSNQFNIDIENSCSELVEKLHLSRQTLGCEFVTSSVLDTSTKDYLYTLKALTNFLLSKGENPKSYRAGFHVHINLSYNLRILKSVLRLSRHLEQVLYLLGGMGYDYRGFKNDSTYCRPITKFGPVCVPTGSGEFSQVFTLTELLKCKNTAEFKVKYGDIANLRESHYIPIRYHGINLLPLFTQGSLEFRMFNKSLNPYFLMAIIEFCKAFAEFAVHSSFDSLKEENLLKENSVFDLEGEINRPKIIETFTHFLELSNLRDEQVIEILYDILYKSSVDSLVLPNEYIFSHLMSHRQGNRCPTHWRNSSYTANKIPRDEIHVPRFEDIHVLRENRNENIGRRRPELFENLNMVFNRRNAPERAVQTVSDLRLEINERYGLIISSATPTGNRHEMYYLVDRDGEEVCRVYFNTATMLISDVRYYEEDQELLQEETPEEFFQEENEENPEIPYWTTNDTNTTTNS